MPSILIITQSHGIGGTEKHVSAVADGLRRRGWAVDVAMLDDGIRRVWQAMSGKDIVHFFLPRPYVIGSLLAMLRGNKVRIMSRRSLIESYQTRLIRKIEKWLHGRTSVLIGNSPAVVAQLKEEAPTADIRLIRNAV